MKINIVQNPNQDTVNFEQLDPGDLFISLKDKGTWMKLGNTDTGDAVDLVDGLVGSFFPDREVTRLEGELSVWRKS